ncbi:MAG: 30S ribosomal protein S21 [Deltaproteobacteria bacterium]|nr:30S ribosomal protein S21 [Deltaproteobacteria bacterium]
MQLDGLQRELKNRRFYEKPSVKKRRKMQEAERRRQVLFAIKTLSLPDRSFLISAYLYIPVSLVI